MPTKLQPCRLVKFVIMITYFLILLLLFFRAKLTNEPHVQLPKIHCYLDRTKNETKICQPKCPYGFFALPTMKTCHKWLTCRDLKSLEIANKELTHSFVKTLYLAQWEEFKIVYANLTNPDNQKWRSLFANGIEMFRNLHGIEGVAQFVGSCNDTSLMLQYYQLGDLTKIEAVLERYPQYDTIETRFKVCKSLTTFFSELLLLDDGARVMEDTDNFPKFLSQFLLMDDLNSVVAADIDILPIDESLTHCRDKELFGEFLPPELLCDNKNKSTVDRYNVPITHKSDVWKLGKICEFLMHFESEHLWNRKNELKRRLTDIFHMCTKEHASDRPNALQLLQMLRNVNLIF